MKDEMLKKKFQGKPKTTTRRMFSSNFTTPTVCFATALRSTSEQNKRNSLCHAEVPCMNKHEGTKRNNYMKQISQ
jgi:hypothetical protein